YSSVAHIALVISAIFSIKKSIPTTAIIIIIRHGLSSSALFFLVTIIYNSHHTRNTLAFKGLLNTSPN
ncbi:NADH-quinone oxidoreductase subunit M, partial [Brumimicrobium salinarum]